MRTLIIVLLVIIGMFSYYMVNDSFRYSVEAKAYYELGEYAKAEKLANDAYKLDKYNTMAFTILTQAKIAKIWQDYIQEGNVYFAQISSISNKDKITQKDKIRIKMMLQIIIGGYKTLKFSPLLNKDLKEAAQKNYKKAKELYNGIFKKTT